jgi:YegS/Rv2252/BmrU family lipid kinase
MSSGAVAVVLNASSGHGAAVKVASQLTDTFEAAGREARITLAKRSHQLRDAVQRAVESGPETLVVGGGDGTVNIGASAAVERGITLGVLPLGTLNHFARDVGLPLDLEQATRVILEGIVCKVDVGEVNGRIFLNNASLGVYPAVVRLREKYRATLGGKWIAAFWAALAVLRRRPFLAVRVQVEGQAVVRRTPLVLVSNNEYRGSGIHAGTRESLAHGRLGLYVLNAQQRQGLLRLAFQVLLQGAERVKELDFFTVEEVAVETRRRRLQLAVDGEVFTVESPLHYRVRPAALHLLVPPTATGCYPHATGASSSR